ncbi:ribosomal protein L36 [Lecanora helva]
MSILVQLLHISAPTRSGVTYYFIHFIIWFNLLFYAAVIFVTILICQPRAKFWNPTLPWKCVDINSVSIITSVINAASDLVLLTLPIVYVWKLQMNLKRKIGVSAVFATAGLIMRITTAVRAVHENDLTWYLLPEGLWGHGEISSCIISGCMPTLPQFFRHFIPKIRTALSSGSRVKPAEYSGSSEQIDRMKSPKPSYPRCPSMETDSYMELEGQGQGSKTFNSKVSELRVWSHEVSANGEDGLMPIAEDGTARTSHV